MRVLIADKLAPLAEQRLTQAGHEVIALASVKGDELEQALRAHTPEVLIVRSTKVEAKHLAASRALSLVVRAGAGVNTIDLQAAGALGVFVANCPGSNSAAVAELTMGLLVALDRQLPDNVVEARAGRWNKGRFSEAAGLKGRTLGLLGMGQIGQEVALRAHAFGMRVVAWSRSLEPARAAALHVQHAASPLEVARSCDFLSVHLALSGATRGLVDATILGALRDGACLINTSRSEVVDEAALLRELDAGRLRAGLDVFEGEPPGKAGALESPLAAHPRVYLTHHIGASTEEAQDAVAEQSAHIVTTFARTGSAPNCVNLVEETSATECLIVRHHDRVGALASVLELLREAEINVQEMSNTIFSGGKAAVARIQVNRGAASVVERLSALPEVLHVAWVPIARGGAR
jgi:D-3-phosphoglycerate dehydrogenase